MSEENPEHKKLKKIFKFLGLTNDPSDDAIMIHALAKQVLKSVSTGLLISFLLRLLRMIRKQPHYSLMYFLLKKTFGTIQFL